MYFVLSIREDNKTLSGFVTTTEKDETHGLWDIIISGKLNRNDIAIEPSDVYCILVIPNTTYIKRTDVSQFSKFIEIVQC